MVSQEEGRVLGQVSKAFPASLPRLGAVSIDAVIRRDSTQTSVLEAARSEIGPTSSLKPHTPSGKSEMQTISALPVLSREGAASVCACCLVRRAFGETARIRGRLARGSLEVS